MTGSVSGLRALIQIALRLPGRADVSREFVVDTGFAGSLALPVSAVIGLGLPFIRSVPIRVADGRTAMAPLHAATVVWNGSEREVEVVATGARPLVGTLLLAGHELVIQFADGGLVSIQPL